MKNLILIIGILIGLTNVVSAEVVGDPTRKVSSKSEIKKNFETSFTNELVKYIETGDVSDFLIESLNQNEIGFTLINTKEYQDNPNIESFKVFLKTYLDIRTTNINLVKDDHHVFNTKEYEFGDVFKISIYYEDTQRRDDVIVSYNHNHKVVGLSIWKDVYNDPYFDGELNKIVGLD
jgi:hypothetical protein